ncbi:MAG: hypothetical protein COA79_03805 [Planctomycetota bacterium]|nr:MAG: hypothetical protein COA79_03805 [Planctomycetota bacterium]
MQKIMIVALFTINFNIHLYAEKDPFLSPFEPKIEPKVKEKILKKLDLEVVKPSLLTPALKTTLTKIETLLKAEKTQEAKEALDLLIKTDSKVLTIPVFNQIKDDLENLKKLEKELIDAVNGMNIKGKIILPGSPNILLINDHPVKEKENLKHLLKLESNIILEVVKNKKYVLRINHIYKSFNYK